VTRPGSNMLGSAEKLTYVLSLARQAGSCILAERVAGLTTRMKPDGSPQTSADRAAEALIITGLRQVWPDVPVIAEESNDPPQSYNPLEPYWLVDPLDGTKGFVAGSNDFSVNITLMLKGRPAFGVIYGPQPQELSWNDGAVAWYQTGDAAPIMISCRPLPAAGQTMITGRQTYTGKKLSAWMARENIAEHLMLTRATGLRGVNDL
jgi:3'(2'), 5'-bisphosphate nucleotidase